MDTDTASPLYCSESLKQFLSPYDKVHGVLSLTVCVFGSIFNVLVIAVLTRPQMRSPLNVLLASITSIDLALLLGYIPSICNEQFYGSSSRFLHTRGWTFFIAIDLYLITVFHFILTWLMLTLAVWHYHTVLHPRENGHLLTTRRAIYVIISACIISPLLCISNYLMIEINSREVELFNEGDFNHDVTSNSTRYYLSLDIYGNLYKINLWMFSIVLTTIPSIVLAAICASVECKRGKNYANATFIDNDEGNVATSRRPTDPPLAILMVIFCLFLLVEFPNGVLSFLSTTLGETFMMSCHGPLVHIIQITWLLTASLNFFLYLAFCRQFRAALMEMLCSKMIGFRFTASAQNQRRNENPIIMNETGLTQV